MIITTIMGGLGNQFFTYATAYALAKKFDEDLMLDLKIYQTTYSLRVCQLEEHNVKYTRKVMSRSFGHNRVAVKSYRMVHDFLLKHKYKVSFIDEKEHFVYQDIDVPKTNNVCLRGYWQCHRYFDDVREDLIRQFTPKSLSQEVIKAAEFVEAKKTIAVHIRRTDYKTFKGGKCLSIDYYNEAMKRMREKLGYSPNFLIFTDDVDFCREVFSGVSNISYIGDIAKLSDIEELYVMSKCGNFIIANSSFSWWAAYLSTKADKTVYCPVVDFWKEDFYMPEWSKIDASLE